MREEKRKDSSKKSLQLKSIFLLIVMLFNTFYPTTAFAISDGPNQVDFESYEDFNSTDMVNLVTGDFTYNIPALNIPSPEGGFQIPLSYHAGIELNEESSWVGLGWSLNPGVLSRNVSMYPDDYAGEGVSTQVTNAGGNGYIKSFPFYTNYYDSKKGTGGAVNLLGIIDFGWKSQRHFGIAPLGLTLKDGAISYDSKYMTQGLISTAQVALSTFGGPVGGAVSSAYSVYSGIKSKDAAASQMGTSNVGGWTQTTNVEEKGGLWGLWGKKIAYKYYLDNTKYNAQYGALYLGDMNSTFTTFNSLNANVFNNSYNPADIGNTSFNNAGRVFFEPGAIPSSDMFINYDGAYETNFTPAHLSLDNFNVKATGVSGNIQPYRMDIGSLCNQQTIGLHNASYMIPQYLPSSQYKVPFKYVGDFSNSYNYQTIGSNITSSGDMFTVSNSPNPSTNLLVWNNTAKTYVNYAASGSAGAYNTNYNINSITEPNRTGLFNKQLVHEKHIEWYTNAEITNGSAQTKGFMNTHQGYDRTTDSKIKSKGIGGFSITNESGVTYHFTIPVYNKLDRNLVKDNTSGTNYIVNNDNYYATMWLLTGITGSDFVDRGTTGIIDNQDWGYWIKFDYGKFATNFAWKNPYYSTVYDGVNESFKHGIKETYYLDKISTRSHTALFVKELKSDGKSYYESGALDPFGNTINTQKPSSSLKLNDVYVLENSDYEKLISTSSGGYGLTNINSGNGTPLLNNGDTFDKLLDVANITPAIQQFITANQLQNLHFNYDYSLCNNTYNSFDFDASGNPPTYNSNTTPANGSVLKGKLTLKSIELKGKNDSKLLPSYVFQYGNPSDANYLNDDGHNPKYSPHKWDGYGMFKSGGTGREEKPHNSERKADQWCLTKVTTPLGSEINVEYERDTYSSVNGYPMSSTSLKLLPTSPLITNPNAITIEYDNTGWYTALTDLMAVGDVLEIDYIQTPGLTNGTFVTTIQNISGNVITYATSVPSGGNKTILELRVKPSKKFGGGIRTKKVITTDENNNQYETRYIYTKNGSDNGITSGVASFEPEFDRGKNGDLPFYKLYDHPYSPILYSNVTVVNGKNTTVFKENSKQTFHFVTPHWNMLTLSTSPGTINNGFYYKYNTIDGTSKIGNLDTVKVINQFNNVIDKTVFEYSDNAANEFGNNIGNYSEASVLFEVTKFNNGNIFPKIIQSYKVKRPNMLKSVTSYKDRLVSKQEMISYDYQTGKPLVVRNTYGGAEKYESETTPAYQLYPAMGSKVYNSANKNMMGANAQTYSYVYDKNNQKRLLGSSVMTWNNNHNYREYNSGSGEFQNQLDNKVWQPFQTFNFKSKVEENGTILPTDYVAFNFTNPNSSDAKWNKTSQINLYDHFSHPLQSQDINGRATSGKFGYKDSYAVSGCENTPYTAWCFSGAEDASPYPNYFEGEVKGSNYQFSSSSFAHTGSYCCRIPSGQIGFSYKIKMADIPASNKKYRASVWVHQNGANGVQLDCKAYDASGNFLTSGGTAIYGIGYNVGYFGSTESQAGNWYLYNIEVDITALSTANYLIFAVENIGAPFVYADDFRVCPLSSPIVANVYDQKTGRVIATLDKENYGMKYFYDDAGKLQTVYKETKLGFTKVSQTTYNYAR